MTDKDLRWNQFIDEVCTRDISSLSAIQKAAVLCFWYDTEMNSGGYSGYMDNFPETEPTELENAITVVGNKDISDNYHKAVTEGEKDDWMETDDAYYGFSPSLCNYLQEYVEKYRNVIFN